MLSNIHGTTHLNQGFWCTGLSGTGGILRRNGLSDHHLVATSGDTGSAVAMGSDGSRHQSYRLAYPAGKSVTYRKQKFTTLVRQITAWTSRALLMIVNGGKDAFLDVK